MGGACGILSSFRRANVSSVLGTETLGQGRAQEAYLNSNVSASGSLSVWLRDGFGVMVVS